MLALIATWVFGPRFTADRGGTVTHFQCQHPFGGLHYKMMCICRYEIVSRMSVSVLLCYNVWVMNEVVRKGEGGYPVSALDYFFKNDQGDL